MKTLRYIRLKKNEINKLREVFMFLKPYKLLYSFYIFINIITLILTTIQPLLFGKVIDGIVRKNLNMVVVFIILILIFSILGASLGYTSSYFSIKITNNLEMDVKKKIFTSIVNMPLSDFDKCKKGEFYVNIENDVKEFSNIIVNNIPDMVNDLLSGIVIGAIMFSINVILSLVILLTFPCVYFISCVYGKKMRLMSEKFKKEQDDYVTKVQEYFNGLKTIKIFRSEDFIVNRYINSLRAYCSIIKKIGVTSCEGNLIAQIILEVIL